jgi:hypothetical protein
VDCVEPSPHKEGKAYAAILRYQLGDWKPYIFRTTDSGKSWTLITNGIPNDYPVRVVREDPTIEGLLYAGTEYGLFISLDDGQHWQSFQQNLPVTPVTDIKIFRKDLTLSTMGRSFWILDNISPLHQLAEAKKSAAYLYKPLDTYRYRYSGSGKNEVPYYPASSAIIDYYLKSKPVSDIKIEILKDQRVIRTFTSIIQPKDTVKTGRDMTTNFVRKDVKADLSKSPGVHRFRWDLLHEGPWDKDPARSKKGGNMVSPGEYEVRLTVDGKVLNQKLNVLMDPRLQGKVSLEDIRAEEALALQVKSLEDSSKRLADKIKTKRKEIGKLINEKKATEAQLELDKQLAKIEGKLVTQEGSYEKPMLIAQLNYLRGLLDQADQRPGKDAEDRFLELKQLAEEIFGEYAALKEKI